MSVQKQRRETVRTWKHLINWHSLRADADQHFDRIADALLSDASKYCGIRSLDIADRFQNTRLYVPFFSFCMDQMLLDSADEATSNLVDSFIAKRGWREKPLGRRYLQLFVQSEPQLLDIVDVKPGESVSVRPAASKLPPIVVYEASGSETLGQYDCLIARILPMPSGRVFAPGLLPVDHDIGQFFGQIQLQTMGQSSQQSATGSFSNALEQPLLGRIFTAWTLRALALKGDVDQSLGSIEFFSNNLMPKPQSSTMGSGARPSEPGKPEQPQSRERLLARIRKLFAMAQETEASPHEAEIALRRCQSLMTRFGITEEDLTTSEFGTQQAYSKKRIPMHVQYLSSGVAKLHDVLFVTGGRNGAEFRGFEIDVEVARLTLDYLLDSVERSLASRKRQGGFPAGRSAAYDYRVSFAIAVCQRIDALVEERKAQERSMASTGTSLTIRKREIVERECAQGLTTRSIQGRGAVSDEASLAGRADGQSVSLEQQIAGSQRPLGIK